MIIKFIYYLFFIFNSVSDFSLKFVNVHFSFMGDSRGFGVDRSTEVLATPALDKQVPLALVCCFFYENDMVIQKFQCLYCQN